ncbi:MAG: AMP-dependent synthetase/ligase [Capsulimonadaceae bacterium]
MPESLNTVNKRFAYAAHKYANRPALSRRAGAKNWQTYTFREIEEQVRGFSVGLRTLGIERGDRVAIISENRPEWAIADLAIMAAGAITVPIYPTLPASQVRHIAADSGAVAVILADAEQQRKIESARAELPALKHLITLAEGGDGDTVPFAQVVKNGRTAESTISESFEERRDSVQPGDLMSLVYTSGTTGAPKGAMLTHANMMATLNGVKKALPIDPPEEVFLSFLPLCHVFERVVSCLALTTGCQTYYNDSVFRLADNLADVRPTILQCVPRVFESIHERVIEILAKEPEDRQHAVHMALGVGDKVSVKRNAGEAVPPWLLAQYAVADSLVLSKLRARFGGRIKFCVCGGAPLNPTVTAFFNAIGIPLLEAWGLTETTAASSINPFGRAKVGTVGRAGFGAEVTTADDGELLVRGDHVMRGYWNIPEATAEAIDPDGWFHTGDIGMIDDDGYIRITDRKKDILVLGNGKKVAPQPIEVQLKRNQYISEVVLIGDHTGNVSGLVVPNFERLIAWAKEQGRADMSPAALAADPAVRRFLKSQVEESSADLADFEKPKRIVVLERPLSVEEGELTPTLKVRRKVVTEKYAKLLTT